MSIPSAPINILTFPQRWDPAAGRLSLTILFLPKGDPTADFVPAFPDANLSFEARLIPSLDQLPTSVPAGPPLLVAQNPIERRQFFDELIASFDLPDNTGFQVKAHAPGPVPPSPKPREVKKYLTSEYRAAWCRASTPTRPKSTPRWARQVRKPPACHIPGSA